MGSLSYLMVLMPFTAAKVTFAFSALVKILRLLSLLVKPFFMTGYSLNYCPEFGIHYNRDFYEKIVYPLPNNQTLKVECVAAVRVQNGLSNLL